MDDLIEQPSRSQFFEYAEFFDCTRVASI